MKHVAFITAALFISTSAMADKYVSGYTRSNGTYVEGHYRSESNSNRYDNRSSESNGGSQRDECSSGTGATNKSNSSYDWRDNDKDGVSNSYDSKPESKRSGW